MSLLTIAYDYGGLLFSNRNPISVSIEGYDELVLDKGESRTLGLEDGSYTVRSSSLHCKKTLHLHLEGDDSFYLTWNRLMGGIIVSDSADERTALHPAIGIWFLLVIVAFFVCNAVLLVVEDRGIITDGERIIGLAVLTAATLALLLAIMVSSSRDIAR